MNMQLVLGLWAAVFVAWATVALFRWQLGKQEDDHLHVMDSEQQLIATQTTIAHKLDVLDRWKTGLLILTIIGGLLVGGLLVYQVWVQSTSTIQLS